MNKIYKVVFNEATQTWVAVGEDAKAKKHSASSLLNSLPNNSFKSKFLSLAVAVAVLSPLGLVNTAEAAPCHATGFTSVSGLGNNDGNCLALGYNAKAWGNSGSGNSSIAVGRNAKAYVRSDNINTPAEGISGAIAIGEEAWALTKHSVVIGSGLDGKQGIGNSKNAKDSHDKGGYSVSIGSNTGNFLNNGGNSYYANTKNTTAIGHAAHTHAANSLAMGFSTDATGERSFALGTASTNVNTTATGTENPAVHKGTRAAGQGSIAIGDQVEIYSKDTTDGTEVDRDVNDAIAIGTGSFVKTQNSVALGGGISYTSQADDGTLDTKYWNGSWQDAGKGIGATVGTGSIGGVAIGGASADSITSTSVSNYTSPATIGTSSSRAVSLGSGSKVGNNAQWAFAGAGGTVKEGAAHSIAIGRGAIANSLNTTNPAQNPTAIANSPSIAIGYNSAANYTNAVAIGTSAYADNIGAVAIGGVTGNVNGVPLKTKATGERSVAVGHTSNATAKDALAMVGGQAYGNSSISIGRLSKANGTGAIAFGSGEVDNTNTTQRNYDGSFAAGTGSIAIGRRAEAVSATVTETNNKGYISVIQEDKLDDEGNLYVYDRKLNVHGQSGGQRIAIGDAASAYNDQSIAIGGNTISTGYAAIAIGGDDVGQTRGPNSYKPGSENIQPILNNLSTTLTDNGYDTSVTLTNSIKGDKTAYQDLTLSYGDASTAFGFKAVSQGHLSNAFGMGARTIGNSSIAFGTVSTAGAENSIAMGTVATTGKEAVKSTAIGYMSQTGGNLDISKSPVKAKTYRINEDDTDKTVGDLKYIPNLGGTETSIFTGSAINSVAVGEQNKVLGSNSTAVGQGNVILASNSGAFGDPNVVFGDGGSYAVGNNNVIGSANTFALGSNINATADNSVFLGDNSAYVKEGASSAGRNGTVKEAKVNVITYGGFAGEKADGVVSVGNSNAPRRIQNVAAGLISKDSTDAINGSQLWAVLPEYQDENGNPAGKNTAPKKVRLGDTTYILAGDAATMQPIQANTTTGQGEMIEQTIIDPITGNRMTGKWENNFVTAGDVVNTINGTGWFTTPTGANPTGANTPALVNAGKKVDFINGNGTTANVNLDNAGNITVAYDVNQANLARSIINSNGSIANPVYPTDANNNPIINSYLTAGDTINAINSAYWNVGLDKTAQAGDAKIHAGDRVGFVAGNGIKIAQDRGSNFTFSVDFLANQVPVVYTDTDGNKIVKNGNDWTYLDDVPASGNNPAHTAGDIYKGDVIASMNSGNNKTEPTFLTNVASNLAPVTNTGDNSSKIAPNTGTTNANLFATPEEITKLRANTGSPILNNAATVGDVLNAGWNLKANNETKDFVTHADTVNFVNGAGTKANIDFNSSTGTSNVTFNIATDGTTTKIDNGNLTVATGGIYAYNDKGDLVDSLGNKAPAGVGDNLAKGKVISNPVNGGTIATIGDVANAINSSGWNVVGNVTGTGKNIANADGKNPQLINPSNTVALVAGDGLTLKQDNKTDGTATFTFANAWKATGDNNGNLESITIAGAGTNGGDITYNISSSNTAWNTTPTSGANAGKEQPVKAGDTVNFVNGIGTTASVVPLNNANGYNVSFNVATAKFDNNTYAGNDGKIVNPNTTSIAGNSYLTAQDTVNAINNVSWNVGLSNSKQDNDAKIKAGDRVGFVAGKGITIEQDKGGANFTFANAWNAVGSGEGNTKTLTKITAPDENGNIITYEIPATSGSAATGAIYAYNDNGDLVDSSGNKAPQGVGDNLPKGKVVSNPINGGNVATIGDVANAVNNSGWNVVGAGNKAATMTGEFSSVLIKPSDTVKLEAGEGLTLNQSGSNFTFANAWSIKQENVNSPLVINNGVADYVIAKDDYVLSVTAKSDQDETKYEGADNIVVARENGRFDVKLNDNIKLTDNGSLAIGGTTEAPKTNITAGNITFGDNNGVIEGVKSHFQDPSSVNNAINPANKPDAKNIVGAKNEAATLGDVLNAGWNLASNGSPIDFITHGDGVDFVNGQGTKANVSFNSTTGTTTVAYDVNPDNSTTRITYTDPAKPDEVLTKVGDTYYNQNGDVVKPANPNNLTSQLSAATGGLYTYNPTTKQWEDPNGVKAPDTTATRGFSSGQVVFNQDAGTIATVGDVANAINNSGWNIVGAGNKAVGAADFASVLIKPSDTVKLEAGKGLTLNQSGSNFTFATDFDLTFYSDAEGTNEAKNGDTAKSVKFGNNFYTLAGSGAADTQPIQANNGVAVYTANNADGTPLIEKDGKFYTVNADGTQGAEYKPAKGEKAPNTNNVVTAGDVVNTINNTGWNTNITNKNGSPLTDKDEANHLVNAGSRVDFVNGAGTTVDVNQITDAQGKPTGIEVKYNANVDNTTIKLSDPIYSIAGNDLKSTDGKTFTDAQGNAYTKNGDSFVDAQGNPVTNVNSRTELTAATGGLYTYNPTTKQWEDPNGVKAPDTTATKGFSSGQVVFNQDAGTIATVGDVANAVNNSGWNLTANNSADSSLIKPSNTVSFNQGSNIEVSRNANNITIATKADVNFNSVNTESLTVGGTGQTPSTPAVNFTTGDAIAANVNKPDTYKGRLNLTNADGNNVQIGGVASSLNTKAITPPAAAGADNSVLDLSNTVNPNSVATVGDLQNYGWVVSTNGKDAAAIKNNYGVNFVAGANSGLTSTGTYNSTTNTYDVSYSISKAANPTIATDTNPATATTPAGVVNGGTANQYWDSQQVQNAINNSGWIVGKGASANANDKLVSAGNRVGLVEGDNIEITQNGTNFTVAAKKDVKFENVNTESLTVGGVANTPAVNFTAGDAISANVNTPNTYKARLNIANADGNNVQIGGVASSLNTKAITPPAAVGADNTVLDLGNTVNPNSVATVGDLQNYGWAVSTNGKDAAAVKNNYGVNFIAGESSGLTATGSYNPDTNTYDVSYSVSKAANPTVATDTNPATATTPAGVVNGGKTNQYWDSQQVQNAINQSGFVVGTGATPNANDKLVSAGNRLAVIAGKNVEVSQQGTNITVATKADVDFDTVNVNQALTVQPNANIDMGGNRIQNVAPGVADNDAVNVSQLRTAIGNVTNQFSNLSKQINEVDKNARAGTAAAMAVAGLPQAYLPGKSLMAIGGGTFRGQTGYAIGISSISDGGNWIIKGTASGNSQGHYGATAAIGYQW